MSVTSNTTSDHGLSSFKHSSRPAACSQYWREIVSTNLGAAASDTGQSFFYNPQIRETISLKICKVSRIELSLSSKIDSTDPDERRASLVALKPCVCVWAAGRVHTVMKQLHNNAELGQDLLFS